MARVTISLPDELLERVDAHVGDVPRSVFVRRAVEQALGVPRQATGSDATTVWVGEAAAVDTTESSGASRPTPAESPGRAPPKIPGLVRASSLVKDPAALERQRRLNEGKG